MWLHLVGRGDGDMTPEVGVTGTPVIDPTTGTLYMVSKSAIYSAGLHFRARLHALDRASSPRSPDRRWKSPRPLLRSAESRFRFDPRTESQEAADPPNDDYGDSLLKLSGSLRVLQYFIPSVSNSTTCGTMISSRAGW